jgi:outer membrane protein
MKLVAALALAGFCSVNCMAQSRVATIDLRKVFDGYWKRKTAENALQERAADMEKEHKNLLDDYTKGKEEYQAALSGANDQAVSAEERDKRKKSAEEKLRGLKDKEEVIQNYERTARNTLDEQKKRMRDKILDEIKDVLGAKAKASGFSMIVDTAAESLNGTPLVLYSNNENDITDEILKQLNSGAPEAAKPAPADSKKSDTKKSDAKKSDTKN